MCVWYNIMWSVMSPCCSLHPNLSPTLFAFKHPTWLLRSATSDCHQFKLYFYFHSTTHSSTACQVPSIYIFIQEAKSSNEVRHNLALEVELCNPLYSLYQIIINCQQGDTTLHNTTEIQKTGCVLSILWNRNKLVQILNIIYSNGLTNQPSLPASLGDIASDSFII